MDAFQKVNKPADNFYAFDGQMTEADWGGNGLQFMWAFGGRLFDKEGQPTINTPQNIAGVKAYTDLFKNKLMPPGVVSQKAAGNNEAWLSGQTAAVSNPGSIVLAMRKDNKDLLTNTYLQAFPSQVKPGDVRPDRWQRHAGHQQEVQGHRRGDAGRAHDPGARPLSDAARKGRLVLVPDHEELPHAAVLHPGRVEQGGHREHRAVDAAGHSRTRA